MNRDPLVLCYHTVDPDWPSELAVTPERFEDQLVALADRGYETTHFTRATREFRPKTLVVTFDDGYRSVLTHAAPVLARLGMTATLFVPSALMGAGRELRWPGPDRWTIGPHRRCLESLSWDDLRALADQGWEIGSHARTHRHLTTLDDDDLAEELEGSRAECEQRLGGPCESVAYPYGDVDARVAEATRAAGYVAGATLDPHTPAAAPSDPMRWPRIGVYRGDHDWRFRLKVSPAARRIRLGLAVA